MPDKQRDKTALASLFPDNTSGEISPQDLRDFMESMHLSRGGLYVSASAETSIGVADTYVKAAGTTTAFSGLHRFTMPQDNRLTYTGSAPVDALVRANLSVVAAAANKVVGVKLAKGGVVDDTTLGKSEVRNATSPVMISVLGIVPLATDEYVEVWLTNETDTSGVTVQAMQVVALGLFK